MMYPHSADRPSICSRVGRLKYPSECIGMDQFTEGEGRRCSDHPPLVSVFQRCRDHMNTIPHHIENLVVTAGDRIHIFDSAARVAFRDLHRTGAYDIDNCRHSQMAVQDPFLEDPIGEDVLCTIAHGITLERIQSDTCLIDTVSNLVFGQHKESRSSPVIRHNGTSYRPGFERVPVLLILC